MLKVRFVIFARRADNGEVFEAFRWCGSEEMGIRRARLDAKRFGVPVSEVWAVPA